MDPKYTTSYAAGVKLARKQPDLSPGEVAILAAKQPNPTAFTDGYWDQIGAQEEDEEGGR